MAVFFTADTHFYHERIIEYSNRPFANAWEMNEAMCDLWTSMVHKNDEVYHLGDVGWLKKNEKDAATMLGKLPGKKYLVPGNHDYLEKFALVLAPVFTILPPLFNLKIKVGGEKRHFVLCHYPIEEWDGYFRGSIMLHGHTHGKTISTNMRRFDVGVDSWNLAPVRAETIVEQAKLIPVPE